MCTNKILGSLEILAIKKDIKDYTDDNKVYKYHGHPIFLSKEDIKVYR